MLEVLQFIFSSFWIWLGSFLMLGAVVAITSNILRAVLRR